MPELPPWMRFGLVGLVNSGIDFGLFVVLHNSVGLDPVIAHAIGFSCAAANSFVVNKLWTFEDRDWSRGAASGALKFFAVAIGGLLIGAALIWLLTPPLPAIISKALAIALTFLWNYQLSRRFVFNRGGGPREGGP